jgi:hypothetical protein
MSEDMHPNRSTVWAVAAVAALLAACHPAEQPPRAPEPAQAEADAGAPVLAAVQNARAAIAAGDQVAAFNDVNVGIGYAASLPGAGSALYPPEAAPPGYHSPSGGGGGGGGGASGAGARQGGHGGHHRHGAGQQGSDGSQPPAAAPAPAVAAAPAQAAAAPSPHHGGHAGRNGQPGYAGAHAPAPLSAFDVQVMLQSAQAKLEARDVAGADTDLAAIEAAARGAPPASLPLVRADQSLTLAAGAVSGGQTADLKSQLSTAKAALDTYQAGPHAADAKALAAAIGQVLNQPDGLRALAPAQLDLWRGQVSGWT